MKRYRVRAMEQMFLPEIEIEAESEDEAKDSYRRKWMQGELPANSGDLDITAEEVKSIVPK